MLEYYSYKKIKKHREEKAAREAAAATDKASTTTTAPTGTSVAATSQPANTNLTPQAQPAILHDPHTHNIPRKPLPLLTEEDEEFLRGFVSDEDDAPEYRPVLPTRPVVEGMKVAGDATGNDDQVALRDGKETNKKETYGEYVGDFVGGIRSRFAGKGKEKEHEVDEEKKLREKHEGGRFGFIGRTFSKKVCHCSSFQREVQGTGEPV